ncbi:radical SAM protein [Marinicellulosiphila megalodicopiae]|uniref:radical SAM protein n=1 Tax=Marinicellulosiphila megalodicopiae TaxID=2724896 RepID=UPI003BAF252E
MSETINEISQTKSEHKRKARPYIFYGQTQSLCSHCLELVPAKIIFQNDNVYYQKRCLKHGVQKVLVSTDIEYYKRCKEYIKPGDLPEVFQTPINRGCPYDCGLCPDHEQHSCLAIFDIIDECNMTCPVCYADSSPQKSNIKSMANIQVMLDTLIASESEPDLVQLSGGEPTLHPQFFDILQLIKQSPVRHLMVNTNGIKISQDEKFVKRLKDFQPGFEIYLQFDSFKKEVLKKIRGIDARKIRLKALENLEKHNISTTLVCTVIQGENDDEVDEIIEFAKTYKCIRGVTFQPMQKAGRGPNQKSRTTLSEIRKSIINGKNGFTDADMLPLPCHPENISIGYAIKQPNKFTPVSGLIPKDILLAGVDNSVSMEKNPQLMSALKDVLSLDSISYLASEKLKTLLCCLPKFALPTMTYENVFRVVIMSFMDAEDFCTTSVKRSCVHFVTEDAKIYPFDTYNLFYRDAGKSESEIIVKQ